MGNIYNKNDKNNKGFTLVELIVVLVVLAILAAFLVPELLGYIDRSKKQKYIVEARDIMQATQAGIVEAYAYEKESFERTLRTGPLNSLGVEGEYGYFSSTWAGMTLNGKVIKNTDKDDAKGGKAKVIICKKLVNYLDETNSNVSEDNVDNDADVSVFEDKQAFLVAYNERGKIVYMQYTHDGKLVTFDGKKYTVEDGGNFTTFRN